ncbi:MAG: molybdopterin dehydrogenase FAD-binding protein [Marmoricola sp.]|jgi:carbon-monoxide dehydrogenase medium subunit|nr:molybdopterin dehydrogenase FAD-binding protein [Marmoricola sp.]
MKPGVFGYHRAESVADAVSVLADSGGDAKVLAGGQSLLPLLAMRMSRPSLLVDLGDLPELALKRFNDQEMVIGAMTTHRAVETDPRVRAWCPAIADGVSLIGHAAIRNRGTVGGSVAHGDAAAEWPALCLLLDAVVVARSPRGERRIPVADFFHGFLTTALEEDELLTAVHLRVPGPREGSAFEELARRSGDYAIVGVGARVSVDDVGVVSTARLVLTGVASAPHRAAEAEQRLVGQPADSVDWAAVGEAVASSIQPPADLNGDTEYRRQLSRVLVERAATTAIRRAQKRTSVA